MTSWLQEYIRAAGQSEVPEQYHVWCGLSLLAAAVGRNVKLKLREESPVSPNLYVLLIGPSGVGKGLAISNAMAVSQPLHAAIGLVRGRLSAEGLLVRMGAPPTLFDSKSLCPRAVVWLIQPELAATAMGKKGHATGLARILTDLYDGSDVPIRDVTRTHGEVVVTNPCVNWLAATTTEWLRAVLPAGGMASGFLARVVTVKAIYSGERIPEPLYPPNREEILAKLRAQLVKMLDLRGVVTLSIAARCLLNEWYAGRPEPRNASLRPLWLREPLIATKVAALLALSEPECSKEIERRHLGLAIALIQETLRVRDEQAMTVDGLVLGNYQRPTTTGDTVNG